jgi:hypothetical protein
MAKIKVVSDNDEIRAKIINVNKQVTVAAFYS